MRTLREKQNAIIFISRKGRKGRRISNANYAAAGVVARYARQRTQRQTETETTPPLGPPLQGRKVNGERYHPLSPPETGGSTPQGGGGGYNGLAEFDERRRQL